MSRENVELVRGGIQSAEAFWALLDEYVVWDSRDRPMLDLDSVYFGRDAVVEASRHYWGTWQDYRLEAEVLIDAGSSVVVAVRERGRGKGSGAPFDQRFAQVMTLSRGRIVRWEVFQDVAEALAAVGLSEQDLLNDEIEERLAQCRRGAGVRSLLRDYLLKVQQLGAGIRIVPGDPRWAAIEVLSEGQHVVRVFPKTAKVQVENRVPNSKPGDYGPRLELFPSGRWRVVVSVLSGDDLDLLLRCTSDAITHANGRRVLPSPPD